MKGVIGRSVGAKAVVLAMVMVGAVVAASVVDRKSVV